MELNQIQSLLTAKYEGNHVAQMRVAHFMGLLKTGLDGLATMGVILVVEAPGLEGQTPLPPAPNPLRSLDAAIKLMQDASNV